MKSPLRVSSNYACHTPFYSDLARQRKRGFYSTSYAVWSSLHFHSLCLPHRVVAVVNALSTTIVIDLLLLLKSNSTSSKPTQQTYTLLDSLDSKYGPFPSVCPAPSPMTPSLLPTHVCSIPTTTDSGIPMDSLDGSPASVILDSSCAYPQPLPWSGISCCSLQVHCMSGASDQVNTDDVRIPCLHVPSPMQPCRQRR
jgi:hypothetical protein